MVRIDRVHTGAGDQGTTKLTDGQTVSKADARIAALGALDSVNAALGLVAVEALEDSLASDLARVQNDIFDMGADLATAPGGPYEEHVPRVAQPYVDWINERLDALADSLPPLTSFVLPGGTRAGAALHWARVQARAAERMVVEAWPLFERGELADQPLLIYLNRLSDLLFQWSRVANAGADVLWQPGLDRK